MEAVRTLQDDVVPMLGVKWVLSRGITMIRSVSLSSQKIMLPKRID